MYISVFKTVLKQNRLSCLGLCRFFTNKNLEYGEQSKKFLKDDEIPVEKVRVLKDKKLLGDFTIFEAKSMARSHNLNLILFKANSDPPICVIDNYKEFVKGLNEKEVKKDPPSYSFDPSLKSKTIQISEACATPDLNRKLISIRKFILSGQRVDVVILTKSKKGGDSKKTSESGESNGKQQNSDTENQLLLKIDYIYSRLNDIAKPHVLKNKVNINSKQVLLKFWPK